MSTNSLNKIEEEIARKHRRLIELRREIENVEKDCERLQRAAAFLQRVPDASAEDLQATLEALLQLGETEREETPLSTRMADHQTNGDTATAARQSSASKSAATKDLSGKTMVECAEMILGENPGESLHYSAILKVAIARGYSSNRKNSDPKKVERSFAQTLTKVSRERGVVERTGEGMFRLRAKAKADAG